MCVHFMWGWAIEHGNEGKLVPKQKKKKQLGFSEGH